MIHFPYIENGGVLSLVGAGGKTSLMFRLAGELSRAGDPVLTTTTTNIMMPSAEQSPHVIVSDSVSTVLESAERRLHISPHVTAAAGRTSSPYGEKFKGFSPDQIDELFLKGRFKWIIVEADGAARMPLKAPAEHEPVIPGSTNLVIGVVGLDAVGKPADEPVVFRPHIFCALTGIKPGAPVTPESVYKVLSSRNGIIKGSPDPAKRIAFLNKADYPAALDAGSVIIDMLKTSDDGWIHGAVMGCALGDPMIKAGEVWS